jgi:hypothetical protein
MTLLTNMLKELRERKLWPIALGLVVALVAVPLLLSKNAPSNPVTALPTGGLPYSSGAKLPAISVETTPGASKFAGRGRDPFTPQHIASTVAATTPTSSTPSSGSGTTSGSGTGSTGSTPTGSGSTTPATTSPSTPSTPAPAPSPAPKPPTNPGPSTLTPTQSYQVSLALTSSNGALNTIDPLERLSVLPSAQQPLVVELGVVNGGRHVLFAVEPGSVVSGPGTCTPGPIDCEILSLAPGQTEGLSKQTPTGSSPVALFAVNSITVAQHASVAAADKARHRASEAGRKLVGESPLSAISLFQYDPSVGAVVDLRNLTVGGN